jgi:hypothetical protein
MFPVVLFLIVFAAYLAWSLASGKVFLTKGTNLRRQTVMVHRQTSPITFWVVWSSSTVGLLVFTAMLLRNIWN